MVGAGAGPAHYALAAMEPYEITTAATDTTGAHRLGRGVLPHRYELELAPDLDTAVFSGTVSIDLEVREATDTITLHAVDLDITTAWTRPEGGRALDATVEADPEREWVVLHLDFSGTLNDQLVGFYRSAFSVDGEAHHLAVTQFESTHARRAFPCFDEPGFKARFGISLVVADGLTAVSNAAELDRQDTANGTQRITFADTMRMSTYLVAFVVGPLEVTEAEPVRGRGGDIPLRIVHPPGKGHLCDFALEVADAGVRFFEDYYAIAYPGDKIDLVAVPDFAFGAMENLGCITFREVLLLVDPTTATPQELQRVADVVNHELAHMWFGDLVTMKWWNGIWLNEAFATFMETSASDAFRPEWQAWTAFGLARAAAFDTDALLCTRPIEYEVVTPEDAEAMFDVLTYEKGCSVVRMLEQYLGTRAFRDGIRAYLRLNAYGNTETTDLWDALEEESGEPVRRIMDAWIFQGGHPLVTATATATGVRFDQQRALLDPGAPDSTGPGAPDSTGPDPGGRGPESTADRRWPVPLLVEAVGDDRELHGERVLLDGPTTLDLGSPVTRVQPNVGGHGFYRSLLDDRLRLALAEHGGTPLERFVLVDDTWYGVLAGHVGLDAMRATVAVVARTEDDPSVWRRLASLCSELKRLVAAADRGGVEAWACGLAASASTRFPVTAEGRDAEVAAVLFSLAGVTGADPGVARQAREFFAAAGAGGAGGAGPAIAAAALEVVAATAGPAEHAEIERRWREAATPQEEQRYLSALVSTRDVRLFAHALTLAGTEVRTQDAPYLLRRAMANVDRGAQAWAYLARDWDHLDARLPATGMPRMLEGVRGFTDAALARSVEAFLAEHPLATGELQVAQHIERMWANVRAAERIRG